MSQIGVASRYCFIVLLSFSMNFCLFCCTGICASQTASSSLRSSYDLVMGWVNFFIMATIFFKYGYSPLKDFIQMQKDDIKKEIDTLEARRSAAALELDRTIKTSKANENRLAKIRERIVTNSEMKCRRIVKQAHKQSLAMLESTHRKTKSSLVEARKMIRNEVIDIAATIAEEKLRPLVDAKHDKALLKNYLENI